ncbi:hypothetical protein M427DRAFT_57981 [Gonapodya prolifera JEL478]|uniref:Uncharacterized protein n=1 Tax=Gonapodya prolifera (strain JEL478) TaxID=1344416 RepID=A0A139ABW9_GONPJ|nr:hypothetical protein M427DRAFT_57981 [Gonapodya prolifera JEL478]|eukprot:KXS13975.1 hypothetical protein M427DRAFT_57981 [Gonapodya prolifera JEL478]
MWFMAPSALNQPMIAGNYLVGALQTIFIHGQSAGSDSLPMQALNRAFLHDNGLAVSDPINGRTNVLRRMAGLAPLPLAPGQHQPTPSASTRVQALTLNERITAFCGGFSNCALSLRMIVLVFAAEALPEPDSPAWGSLVLFWEQFSSVVAVPQVRIVGAVGSQFMRLGEGVAQIHATGTGTVDNGPGERNVTSGRELVRRMRTFGWEMQEACRRRGKQTGWEEWYGIEMAQDSAALARLMGM